MTQTHGDSLLNYYEYYLVYAINEIPCIQPSIQIVWIPLIIMIIFLIRFSDQ